MEYREKKYLKLKPNNQKVTDLKVEVYYSLGGYNYFTYKKEPRGYYLSVSPVERAEYGNGFSMEGYRAFSGYKFLIEEVTRKSEKGFKAAVEKAKGMENNAINVVLAENYGLELEEC